MSYFQDMERSPAHYVLNGTYFYCPVDLALSVIGGRWKGLVFWSLRNGPMRYSELKRALVGINDKMLVQVLRHLEQQGVLRRNTSEAMPSRVDYALTAVGEELLPTFHSLSQWGSAFTAPARKGSGAEQVEPADQ